jgi:hypothetical protein
MGTARIMNSWRMEAHIPYLYGTGLRYPALLTR